jgi:hypothetical protein
VLDLLDDHEIAPHLWADSRPGRRPTRPGSSCAANFARIGSTSNPRPRYQATPPNTWQLARMATPF